MSNKEDRTALQNISARIQHCMQLCEMEKCFRLRTLSQLRVLHIDWGLLWAPHGTDTTHRTSAVHILPVDALLVLGHGSETGALKVAAHRLPLGPQTGVRKHK